MRERFKETTKPRERENWPYQSNVGMGDQGGTVQASLEAGSVGLGYGFG